MHRRDLTYAAIQDKISTIRIRRNIRELFIWNNKRRFGDRSEGRRIRSGNPIDRISPYIMKTRNTSSNFLRDSIEITPMEQYIHEKRREGLDDFGILHVFLAAYVRTVSQNQASTALLAGKRYLPARTSW